MTDLKKLKVDDLDLDKVRDLFDGVIFSLKGAQKLTTKKGSQYRILPYKSGTNWFYNGMYQGKKKGIIVQFRPANEVVVEVPLSKVKETFGNVNDLINGIHRCLKPVGVPPMSEIKAKPKPKTKQERYQKMADQYKGNKLFGTFS